MPENETERLRRSWVANADAWRDAVREQRIESRRVATDAAIVEAVLAQHPRTVLDLGCGEGWLARALASHGIAVTGVDASPELIAAARELGGGEFHVAAYDELPAATHDVTVANFSLLEENLAPLLRSLSSRTLIVQTVHPQSFGDEEGWRVETFATMGGDWPEPMPWYFRTRASWERLFAETGWAVREVREPGGRSLLFICARTGYTLGATEPELRRLVDLASHESDRVIDAAARAGIGAGATVLDLGCGPLGALRALVQVVGSQGTVIGVDASAGALEKARTLVPEARFVEADVHELSLERLGLDRGADLAYCRLMLVHQRDPERTLRQMAALLRPGGVVVAHEPSDLMAHAPSSEPAVPAMTRVWELVIAAARARGAQTDFGRRGRAYLERAGFEVESHRAYFVHYPPAVGYEIPRVALASLRPVLAAHDLAGEEELARLDCELERAKIEPGVQWVSSPLMIEWIGRKGERSA